MTRRRWERRRESRKIPLVLLAGLPHPICAAVAKKTETNLSPSPKVIFQPSGYENNELYRPQTISALMRAVSDYAVRHVHAYPTILIPSQIVLAYVPASDEEHLLAEFDFFVFPVRLTLLAQYDEHGRQQRHNRNLAEEYVVSSLETALGEFSQGIKRRLSSVSSKEALFLPPRNFWVSRAERMSDVFLSLRQGAVPWGYTPPVKVMKVTSEELPKHVAKGKHREVISDSRSLLFPHDQSNHGPSRDLIPSSSHEERRQFMRSGFRFGVPLLDGYHHDVQFGGRGLSGETFECCRAGLVQLSCEYANIYPNDFIRPSKK